MGPTGVMDNKRQQLQDADFEDQRRASGDFTICDLGDEEVHFSRHSSDLYYYCHQDGRKLSSVSEHSLQQQQQHIRTQAASDQHQLASAVGGSNARGARKQSSGLSSLDPGHFSDIECYQHTCASAHAYQANSEQVSSSRLLNTLGNKLRRGSNYLSAPTKLLGQYLLGITIQSWSEFFNTSRMMKVPSNRHQLTTRLLTNLSHFQGNYLCVSLILVIYCILTSPLLLIAIAAYLLTLYLVTARTALGKQTRIFGYRLNLQQQYSFITMLALPPLWIAGAPSAVFWVIGASFFVVGLHASMFANEQPVAEQHMVGASRAHQSLSLHTPIHYVNQQSYTRLGPQQGANNSGAAQSAAHYYNHYPGVAKSGYIQVAQATHSNVAASSATSSAGGAGSYVSSAIYQWIPFSVGGGSGGSGAGSDRSSASQAMSSGAAKGCADSQADRNPEVKVISRDYAGLGRVYEV